MGISKGMKEKLEGRIRILTVCAIIGLALSAFGFFQAKEQFAVSYHTSFMFWMGLTVGCLPIVFIHCLTHGGWGFPIR